MSKAAAEHKAKAPTQIDFAVITISTSRFKKLREEGGFEDPSGDLIVHLLERSKCPVTYRKIVADDSTLIKGSVEEALERSEVEAVVTCGGTGVSPTDLTIETIKPMLEKELPGFGELLRKISFEQIGSPAILTRAMAGVIGGKAVFCIPGSPQAVETALKNLIIPEARHIIKHAREK